MEISACEQTQWETASVRERARVRMWEKWASVDGDFPAKYYIHNKWIHRNVIWVLGRWTIIKLSVFEIYDVKCVYCVCLHAHTDARIRLRRFTYMQVCAGRVGNGCYFSKNEKEKQRLALHVCVSGWVSSAIAACVCVCHSSSTVFVHRIV